MAEKSAHAWNLDFTDDEFVALHAAASAKGIEINDFIVATLRQHTLLAQEIEKKQEEEDAPSTKETLPPAGLA